MIHFDLVKVISMQYFGEQGQRWDYFLFPYDG